MKRLITTAMCAFIVAVAVPASGNHDNGNQRSQDHLHRRTPSGTPGADNTPPVVVVPPDNTPPVVVGPPDNTTSVAIVTPDDASAAEVPEPSVTLLGVAVAAGLAFVASRRKHRR